LEFECNIGDLQSIVKVEKRRSEVLSKIKEFEGKETAQLVDRYKFLDLYPCTATELKSIGWENYFLRSFDSYSTDLFFRYTEVINITGAGKNHILQSIINSDADAPLPTPDYSQMIPFKPKSNPLPGEHPVPGTFKITCSAGTYQEVLTTRENVLLIDLVKILLRQSSLV
jgi:cleavage stimulation factor subunit 3